MSKDYIISKVKEQCPKITDSEFNELFEFVLNEQLLQDTIVSMICYIKKYGR